MKLRIPAFLTVLFGGLLFVAFYPPFDNAQKEAVLMHTILSFQNYYHYSPQEINDDFSEKLYDLYLDRLDGGRRWLIQSDVDQLNRFQTQLDDQANIGSYEFLDLAIKLQDAGIDRSEAYFEEFLDKPFDYTKEEAIERDGEKMPFAKNETELKEYWRKSMKYETMTRLAGKLKKKNEDHEDFKDKSYEELEEKSREEVLKVYSDWYDRLEKRKRNDHLSAYINTMTNLYDPHTGYFEPIDKENFNIGMSGKLKGIGARLTTDGDFTKVSDVIIGGPAWKQGDLEKNDLIVGVQQKGEEVVDITGMNLDEVVSQIRGEVDTEVTLHIKKEDGTKTTITIIRDVVVVDESYAKSLIIEGEDAEPIGYIRLPRFYGDYSNKNGRFCSDDIKKEIEKLKGENAKGIILDLRSNGGGYLNEVVKMSGFFIEEGPVVQVKSRDRKAQILSDDDASVSWNGPLVVMVNSFSASASEILAAALQDYDRAVIVGTGQSTFGKGTVQRFFNLDRGIQGHDEIKPLGEVKITVQNYYRINGGSVQLKGVTPDIILPDNYRYIETGEKEHEYPLQYSTIDPADYSQEIYKPYNLGKIKEKSAYRVTNHPILQKVDANAKRIKEQRDDTTYSLNLKEYQDERAANEKRNKEYKELLEKEVVTDVRNLKADVTALEGADESKVARNDEWLKGVKKDVYLEETLNIIRDMIIEGNLASKQ